MAVELSPADFDALLTPEEHAAARTAKPLPTPQEFDRMLAEPEPQFEDLARNRPFVIRSPRTDLLDIRQTTQGGPRVPLPIEPSTPFEELGAGPSRAAVETGRMAGRTLGLGGRMLKATLGDISQSVAGVGPSLENIKEYARATQPLDVISGATWDEDKQQYVSTPEQKPLPIEQYVEQATGLGRFLGKASLSLAEMEPRLAASFGLGAAGAPASVAAALPMLVTDQGAYDPIGAAIAAGLPGVSHAGEQAVTKILANAPVTKVILNVLQKDPLKLKGKVVQQLGGIEISNDTFRKFLEQGGGFLAANAYLGATAAIRQFPELQQMSGTQRAQWALDLVAQNLAPAILGFVRPGLSKTLEYKAPEIAPELAKVVEELRAAKAGPGTTPPAAGELPAPVEPKPGAPVAPQPAGGPSADQIQSAIQEASGVQAGGVPQIPGGGTGEVQRPAGAREQRPAGAPTSAVAAPTPPSPPSTPPTPPVAPAAIPPLPPKSVPITIQAADGTTYPAAFGGWQVVTPQGEHAPVIHRFVDGAWSTGIGLREGEKIVEGQDQISARPEARSLPPMPEPLTTDERVELNELRIAKENRGKLGKLNTKRLAELEAREKTSTVKPEPPGPPIATLTFKQFLEAPREGPLLEALRTLPKPEKTAEQIAADKKLEEASAALEKAKLTWVYDRQDPDKKKMVEAAIRKLPKTKKKLVDAYETALDEKVKLSGGEIGQRALYDKAVAAGIIINPALVERARMASMASGAAQPLVPTAPKVFTLAELKENLASSGLSKDAQDFLRAFLDNPVLANYSEGLRVIISDAIEGGLQGSQLGDVIRITTNADPITGIHELLHWFKEHILAPEDGQELERIRQETLTKLAEEAREAGREERARVFEDIRDNPTTGVDDFMARKYPVAMQSEIYPLSNVSEFFAHTGSEQFKAKVGSMQEGFWARLKEMLRDFIAALRKALGLKQSAEGWLRNILNGNFKTGGPEVDAEIARGRQGSLKEPQESAPEDQSGMPTEVFGTVDYVIDRIGLSKAELDQGIAWTQAKFAVAGLQSHLIEGPDPVSGQPTRYLVMDDTGFEMNVEGSRLIDFLRSELSKPEFGRENQIGFAVMVGTVVANYHMRGINVPSAVSQMSEPIRQELYRLAQSPRSLWGAMLGAQARIKPSLQFQALNIDVGLYPQLYDKFGGKELEGIVNRIITSFRDYFTEAEIEAALRDTPALAGFIDKALALNRADEGNRVYREAQQKLKPKKRKPLGRLENDARVQEAVEHILAELKKEGIEPKPSPNKPLTPVQKLILMVKPETAAKINDSIEKAVAAAERNAGIKATLMAAPTEAERADMEARFSAGEQPTPEMVERGLDLPEYQHWRVLRDNWLDYSPVTLKLVQDMVRSQFKGTRFNPKGERDPDLRIDLAKLAKSPQDEVSRVTEAYLTGVGDLLDLSQATPSTRDRILDMVERQVTEQLEAARARVREPLFQPPKQTGVPLTAEQRLGQLINAGLLGDPRLSSAQVVKDVAAKGALKRVTPTVGDLIKQALDTPFYRQGDLGAEFARLLSERLGLTAEQAEQAKALFAEAYDQRMDRARGKAVEAAQKALTPQEIRVIKPGKALWQKINQLFNSTKGLSVNNLLEEIAAKHGQKPPSEATKGRLRELAEREMRLHELTPSQKAEAGNDPAKIAQAKAELEALTSSRRADIVRQMGVEWSRITKSLSIFDLPANRQAIAEAATEYGIANTLLKPGFIAYRLPVHIGFQALSHMTFRPFGAALERFQLDLKRGTATRLWQDLAASFADQWGQSFKSLGMAIRSARAEFAGHPEERNFDKLARGVQAIERMLDRARQYSAKGDYVRAVLLYILAFPKLSQRVLAALDAFQGAPIERPEMLHELRLKMRELGKSPAEELVEIDRWKTEIKARLLAARLDAARWFAEQDHTPTKAELDLAADRILRERLYADLELAQIPADALKEKIATVQKREAWQMPVEHGLGGVVAVPLKIAGGLSRRALGLPVSQSFFANAMGNGVNFVLNNTPLYFLGAFRVPFTRGGPSPWFATTRDWMTAHVRAAVMSSIGALLAYLVAAGVLAFISPRRRSREEYQALIMGGHKVGTVEFPTADGFIPISVSVGLLSHFAPWIAAGGAIHDLIDRRNKEQARMNAEAAKRGLQPGTIRPISFMDWLGVFGNAAWASLQSNKTLGGLAGGMTELSIPNPVKAIASTVSPYLLGTPGWQEVSRATGAFLNRDLATVWDYILPGPWSPKETNFLGEPLQTPDQLQRVEQAFTAGTYFGVVHPPEDAAYAITAQSGWRPPGINPSQGYSIGGDYRPMTNDELSRYSLARGTALKQQLSGISLTGDPTTDAAQMHAAYLAANTQALQSVGVNTTPAAAGPQTQAGARPAIAGLPEMVAGPAIGGGARGAARPASPFARRRVRVSGIGRIRGPSLRREGPLRAPAIRTGMFRAPRPRLRR